MQFYQVSSDWIYSPVLQRIEREYGLPGIGFYWKVIAALHLADRPLPEQNLLSLRGRGLQWKEAAELLHHTTEIFVRDKQGLYYLTGDQKASGLRNTHPRTQTGTQASTRTDAQTGSAQVIADNKREEEISAEEKAQVEFSSFMNEHCPHLQLMAEPMTFSQLKKLRSKYTIREIRSVLRDMENKPGLENSCRSCYETAAKWLEVRNS